MSTKEYSALPDGFTPGEGDVIVGRGKVCYQHSGNKRLIEIVQAALKTYSTPDSTKKSKSELIKNIMVQVRYGSPTGGFVKFDSEKGQWFEVGDRIAREKVSQTFRDALNDRYKSSTTSKTLKRRQERINRQVSVGSNKTKETNSSAAAAKPIFEHNELPAAQARVDALLMAASSSAGKKMPQHPTLSNLAPLAPCVSTFLRPTGFLPGPRQGLGATFSTLPNMTPSLGSMIVDNKSAQASAFSTANYGHLFLARRQGQLQGHLSTSLMRPMYQPPHNNNNMES